MFASAFQLDTTYAPSKNQALIGPSQVPNFTSKDLAKSIAF